MIVIGVDPGKHGAIVALGPHGDAPRVVYVCERMPLLTDARGRDEYALLAIERTLRQFAKPTTLSAHVFIERAAPFPGFFKRKRPADMPADQPTPTETTGGTIANYHRGYGVGLFAGLCVGLQLPYTLVPPQTWQRAMLAGTPSTGSTKQRAAIAAAQFFPTVSLVATPRSRKSHDGICDALLIAEFGGRSLAGYSWPKVAKG